MDKRYQVFVSSTFTDLKVERSKVIQVLMEMDCIPCGMELFPAMDEEQFEFIKRIIDDCDYYLLIIGGRYGSVTSEGVSYTEKEYDYAVSKGLKVIALLHGNPQAIPLNKSESDSLLRDRLEAFRKKVSQGRLVRKWSKDDELAGLVALSLSKTIKTFPAIGWVRGDQVSNIESLSEINELRKEKERLLKELQEFEPIEFPSVDNLASMDESIEVEFHYAKVDKATRQREPHYWKSDFTWNEMFAAFSPLITEPATDYGMLDTISRALNSCRPNGTGKINLQMLLTLKLQFQALGLIKIVYIENDFGGGRDYWQLTAAGVRLMVDLRTIKSSRSSK